MQHHVEFLIDVYIWYVHADIWFVIKQKFEEIDTTGIQKDLTEETSHAQQFAKGVADLEAVAIEMQKEMEDLIEICAQFCCYLKSNTITTFVDHIGIHLENLQTAKEKMAVKDEDAIKRIKSLRTAYEKKKQDIQKGIEQPSASNVKAISDPEEVIELSEQLLKFKYSGKFLAEVKNVIEQVRSETMHNEADIISLEIGRSPLVRYIREKYSKLKGFILKKIKSKQEVPFTVEN